MNSGRNALPASNVEMRADAAPSPAGPAASCSAARRGLSPAAVGADDVDVELGQRAPELRDAPGPTGCAVVVDAENAVLVAVERDRLAVALQVRARRREVVERGLDLDEAQLHQAPGGVIDVNQERAQRSTLLEPSVLAPVDLHQFAQAFAPVPRLVRPAQSLVSRQPEPCERHPLAERFLGHPDVVELEQLLLRELGPEVRVALADDLDRLRLQLRRQAPVARLTSLTRRQADWAGLLIRDTEARDLSRAEAHQLCSLHLREPPLDDSSDDVDAVELSLIPSSATGTRRVCATPRRAGASSSQRAASGQ